MKCAIILQPVVGLRLLVLITLPRRWGIVRNWEVQPRCRLFGALFPQGVYQLRNSLHLVLGGQISEVSALRHYILLCAPASLSIDIVHIHHSNTIVDHLWASLKLQDLQSLFLSNLLIHVKVMLPLSVAIGWGNRDGRLWAGSGAPVGWLRPLRLHFGLIF